MYRILVLEGKKADVEVVQISGNTTFVVVIILNKNIKNNCHSQDIARIATYGTTCCSRTRRSMAH